MKCLLRPEIELKHSPISINPEAKEVLLNFVKEKNSILGFSLCLTMELAYRDMKGESIPKGISIMTAECADWCGTAYRDPFLPIARYSKGISRGFNHTWSTILKDELITLKGKSALDIIQLIPTH